MSDIEVAACPNCDGAQVRRRGVGYNGDRQNGPYRCDACGHRFEDPVFRPPRGEHSHTNTNSGLSRQLLDANADDVTPP